MPTEQGSSAEPVDPVQSELPEQDPWELLLALAQSGPPGDDAPVESVVRPSRARSRGTAPARRTPMAVLGDRPSRRRGRSLAAPALLLTLCGGLVVGALVKAQLEVERAEQETAAAHSTRAAVPRSRVVLLGDAIVSDAASGVATGDHWPALLRDAIGGDVVELSRPGAGYTTGPGGETFARLVAAVPRTADVVVLLGGGADASASGLSLAKAATKTFGAVTQRAPEARILVVGPVIRGTATTAQLRGLRAALRSSSAIAQATWIDPIASEWLPAKSRSARSFGGLTVRDQNAVAARMRSAIDRALS